MSSNLRYRCNLRPVQIKDIADLKLDDIRQGRSGVMAELLGSRFLSST